MIHPTKHSTFLGLAFTKTALDRSPRKPGLLLKLHGMRCDS